MTAVKNISYCVHFIL